jgi:exodeoxyribonuclease V
LGGEGTPEGAAANHPDAAQTRRGPGDRTIKVSVRPECFTGAIEEFEWPARKPCDEFDFGYVLTVHKAQGSQWDDVVLFDESGAFPDNRDRWLYTGVTRAAKRLTVVV